MRVAWFRAGSSTFVDDASAAVRQRLAESMTLDIITEPLAHDFVVEQARRPYDVCVFEPRNQPGSEFIWGYLFQYPGVFVLQDPSLHDSRVRALERHRRSADYASEFQFNHRHPSRAAAQTFARGSWPMLRAPLHASLLTVVGDDQQRLELERLHPGVRIRQVPPCVAGPIDPPSVLCTAAPSGPLRVAFVGTPRRATAFRAVERARQGGANVVVIPGEPSSLIDSAADVVVALDSPADGGEVTLALAALAHGKAVVVLERETTAAWPAFDPQTWQPRNPFAVAPPVVVSIDPRDEEHSLMLAIRGLTLDAPRRHALGTAARAWWLAHATPEHGVARWRQVLEEAARAPAPQHPADWPAHLDVDGTEQARGIAADLGVSLDALFQPPVQTG